MNQATCAGNSGFKPLWFLNAMQRQRLVAWSLPHGCSPWPTLHSCRAAMSTQDPCLPACLPATDLSWHPQPFLFSVTLPLDCSSCDTYHPCLLSSSAYLQLGSDLARCLLHVHVDLLRSSVKCWVTVLPALFLCLQLGSDLAELTSRLSALLTAEAEARVEVEEQVGGCHLYLQADHALGCTLMVPLC
jgi:hypothetical protein